MLVKLSSASFRSAVYRLIGNTKAEVNFSVVEDDKLQLQVAGSIVSDIKLETISVEGWPEGESVSATVDQALMLLSNKKVDPVDIRVLGDRVEITQGTFKYSTERSYVEKLDDGAFKYIEGKSPFMSEGFKDYVNSTKALDEIARTLSQPVSNIVIKDKVAYVDYYTAIYKCSVDLPDMTIASVAARSVAGRLSANSNPKYYIDEVADLMHISVTDNEEISIPVTVANMRVVENMAKLEAMLKPIAEVNLAKYKDQIDLICRIYKKMSVKLNICKNDISLYVDNTDARFVIGSDELPMCTIELSTAQLSAVSKLFGEDTGVVVKKGDNKLCLEKPTLRKSLMLAGLIY